MLTTPFDRRPGRLPDPDPAPKTPHPSTSHDLEKAQNPQYSPGLTLNVRSSYANHKLNLDLNYP